MRYVWILALLTLASVCVEAQTLTGQDWNEMTDREKVSYVAGYLDGRVSEVSNVVVLGIQLSAGGRPIAEDPLVGAFIDRVNDLGAVWSDLDSRVLVEAIDRAVSNNPTMLDSALFLFVQEALMTELGINQ